MVEAGLTPHRDPDGAPTFFCTKVSAAALLLLSCASWICMILSILPSFASLLAGAGARFSLAVRMGIAATGFLSGVPLIALVLLILWAGFRLKDRKLGAGILLGAAILVTALVQTLILWSVHDVLPHLEKLGPR